MLVSYKMLTCEILAKDLTKVAFLGLFVEVQGVSHKYQS